MTLSVTEHEFLHPAGKIVLTESTDFFDPHQYFQARKGLYAWNGFKKKVLSVVQPTDGLTEMMVGLFDLVEYVNDAEIRSKFPEDHVFEDASEFCAVLAKMIDQQPNGEKGNLLSNGYCNIFYVRGADSKVFAVHVYWNASVREWSVHARPLGVFRWLKGSRAFSRNC